MSESSCPPQCSFGAVLASPGAPLDLARRLDRGEVEVVTTAAEVLAAAPRAAVAVLGETLSGTPTLEVLRALRQGSLAVGLPVFVIAETYSEAGEAEALAAGADEYLDPAQLSDRVLRRLRARLARAEERRDENPLTGLPGRGRLDRELSRRLPNRGQLAVVALDLRHFKAFNDCYGYARGDRLLLLVRDVLLAALAEQGAPGDLALHLGGDDFFLLTHPDRAEALARAVRERFDAEVPTVYDSSDVAAGGLYSLSRTGERTFAPLTSLTMVAVANVAADLVHAGQLAPILAELKEFARVTGQEELVWDRRRVHDARQAWAERSSRKGEG